MRAEPAGSLTLRYISLHELANDDLGLWCIDGIKLTNVANGASVVAGEATMTVKQRKLPHYTLAVGVVCSAVLWCSTALAGLKVSAPADVDIGGSWKLNPEASDDPKQALEKMRQDMKNRMGGMRGAMGGVPGGGRMGGAMGGARGGAPGEAGGDHESRRRQLEQRLATSEQIQIAQQANALSLSTDNGSTSCDTPEKTQVSTPDGGMADRRCGWDGKSFVIETKSADGFTQRERYELAPDGRLLMVTQINAARMPKITVKRVYERVNAQ